jgi:hypothetical protein
MTPHAVLTFLTVCLWVAFVGGVIFITSLIMLMLTEDDHGA